MKKVFLIKLPFIVALIFAFAPLMPAAEAASVKAVNFYPAGARFTYEEKSDGKFEFDIPGAFDENSVRCLTLENLSSLKVERVAVPNAEPEELAPYEKKVDDAKKARALLESRATSIKSAIQFLSSPFTQAPYDKDSGLDGDGLIKYARDAYNMRLELEAEMVDVNIGIGKAARDISEAEREYADVKARLERKRGVVPDSVVRVRGTTDGPASLAFDAFTNFAMWNVVYEMNLDSAAGTVNAKMHASVAQRTGVDLDGEAAFNTRQPLNAVAPPEISPLTVGLVPAENSAYREQSAVSPARGWDIAGDFQFEKVTAQPPEAISTLSNVSVAGRGKIDGDGSIVRVKLGEFDLKCAPLIISIPEQSREAWIVASIDAIPESFLPGEAELSVDNAASGKTRVAEATASARIPFGMVSRVTAKKTPYVRETASSWIGTGIQSDGYTLEVTNGLDSEREITVIDRLPLPTVDKVTVEVKKIEPKPDERYKENRLTWKMKIKPGETQKITVEYAVKYPGDETLEYR